MRAITRNMKDRIHEKIELPSSIFDSYQIYIETIENGLTGNVLKQIIDTLGQERLFSTLLNTPKLDACYKVDSIDPDITEKILDAVELLFLALSVFNDQTQANGWLESPNKVLGGIAPLDLCQTFKGRETIKKLVQRVECGEFT